MVTLVNNEECLVVAVHSSVDVSGLIGWIEKKERSIVHVDMDC